MSTNIEMNYFNGSSYVILKPKADFSNMEGNLIVSQIPDLDASKIASGILNVNRIPNLNASKITNGVLNTDRIPNLDASKITSGTLNSSRIPNLDMSKITSGNLSGSRVSGNVSGSDYATNSGKVGGYTYSQIISNASGGGGCKTASGSYIGTASDGTVSPSGISNGIVAIITGYRSSVGILSAVVNNLYATIVFTKSSTTDMYYDTESYYGGNTIQIGYNTNSLSLNHKNVTYYYTAFGT